MLYPYFLIPFVIFSLHFLFLISNANPSVDDKMLIAFMKGVKATKISEFKKQKYEAYLGIMYYMKTNWHCDKIAEKFEEHERTECKKYRKYLDILYEYLYREHAGIPTVKPKFVFKKDPFVIEGSIIYLVNCLTKISQFYFKSFWSNKNEYKLNTLFDRIGYFELKLLNEERLNYELKLENELPKLPINEMILQMAIDTANECQTNEIVDGINLQKFDNDLKELFRKAVEFVEKNKAKTIKNDKHYIIISTKFDDSSTWMLYFLNLSKGRRQILTNFQSFSMSELRKNYSTKYKTTLCVVYLMSVEKWRCKKICQINNNNCQKYRKHFNIFYEYLFRIYVEAKSPFLSRQLPRFKPEFGGGYYLSLINVVNNLYYVAKFSCIERFGITAKDYPMELLNEKDFNYDEIEENENGKTKKQILNESTKIEKIRMEFEQKLEKMC